ncbi:TPA: hypothetical protein ACX6SN_000057 [Photobacterium damselae]
MNLTKIMQVMQSFTATFPYNVSIHSYQNGFRSMIGPAEFEDISKIREALVLKGYKETIIKYLASGINNNNAILSTQVEQSKVQERKPTITKEVEQHYIGYRLGKVGSRELIVPITIEGDSKLAKRIGRFSFKEARDLCEDVRGRARIATINEYQVVLSSTEVLNKIGLSVPFWLTSDAVITRSSKGLERRAASPNIQYNVLCSL